MKEPYRAVLCLLFFAACAIRFLGLEKSPPGFYVDEAAAALNVICVQREFKASDGERAPLFAHVIGPALTTPTYLYAGAVWTTLFGHSIQSFRSLAAFANLLTIIGLYFLARLLAGTGVALYVSLAAALSPWAFQFSRIAWDPELMPCFLIWGIYFFLRSSKPGDSIAAGMLLALSAYSYYAARVQIPLLMAPLICLQVYRGNFKWKSLAAFVVAALTTAMPLIVLTLKGEFQGRVNEVGIFSNAYLQSQGGSSFLWLLRIFIKNFLLHFTPSFLLFRGDSNLRHSTQSFGELGWIDLLALSAAVFLAGRWLFTRAGKQRQDAPPWPTVLLAICGIASGIVPAALTWSGIPHALRSIGAWPFVSLLSGLLLWLASSSWKKFDLIVCVVALVFAGSFFYAYFVKYPQIAGPWFDSRLKETAIASKRDGDWAPFVEAARSYSDVWIRYFVIEYGGETCSSSEKKIKELRGER
jgi:hypothetical protein